MPQKVVFGSLVSQELIRLPEIMAVLIGLSIWKPLQLAWLSGLFGGYPLARNIHLAMMFCIIAFLALHLLLVAIYPRTVGLDGCEH